MHLRGRPYGGAVFLSQGVDLVMSGGRRLWNQHGSEQDCQVGGAYVMDHVTGWDFWFQDGNYASPRPTSPDFWGKGNVPRW